MASTVYTLGPWGVNAWDGKKSVLRAAHTLEKPGPWTLEEDLASKIFTEISSAARKKQGEFLVICPTCFSLRGQKTLVFVDVGGAIRGPSCPNCLKTFLAKHPNSLGYRLYVFSANAAEILYVKSREPGRDPTRLTHLRMERIPLKNII